MYRQGDILVLPMPNLPSSSNPIAPDETNHYVLARGEATGHSHRISAEIVELHAIRDQLWIVAPESFEVIHEEHEPLKIPQGIWRVVRQREYNPDLPQRFNMVSD